MADLLTDDELANLRALDTPTVCNALELLDASHRTIGFTNEPLTCVYPHLEPMVGYARTATLRATHPSSLTGADARQHRMNYYAYVAEGGPVPSIAVVQDLDGRRAGFGALWGEVNTNIHKTFGCLGVVTNGSVRDIDANADDFQLLAGMIAPSHGHFHIVDFGCDVRVAGMSVRDGDLIHADRHGAVVIPFDRAREAPEKAIVLARREKLILTAVKSPDFDIDKLRKAIGEADEIH